MKGAEEMEEKLIELVLDVLGITGEELTERYDEATVWDSLRRVEILFAIEDEFDVIFDEEELKSLDTPKKLIAAVLEKAD